MSVTDENKPLILDWPREVERDVADWQEPPTQERPKHLLRKVGKVAAAGALAAVPLTGMVEGAYVAATQFPTTINLGEPGITIDTSLSSSDHTDISFGAPGTLRLPAAHQHEPIVGDIAAKIQVNEIAVSNPGQKDAETLLPLIENKGQELKSRIISTALWRGAEGGAAGLGAGIVTDLSLIAGANWLKSSDKKHAKAKLAAGMAAVTLAGGAVTAAQVHNATPDSTEVLTSIDPSLTQLSPILQDASFSGTGGQAANKLIEMVYRAKNTSDTYWQNAYEQTAARIDRLEAEEKLTWLDDPDIVPAMHITDVHGNYPFMRYYLPELIRKLHVPLVLLTGDQENTGGTTPLDAYAWVFLQGIRPKYQDGREVRVVYAGGNHDALHLPSVIADISYRASGGKPYHPVISLDKNNGYTARLDGLTFVGSPDRNRTTTNDTVPYALNDQLKNDAAQGQDLAKAACAATAADGRPPIVLTHEESAGYSSLLQGCAALALSGHWHITSPIQSFRAAEGSVEFMQNLGSASGDGPNDWVSEYAPPTTEGSVSIWGIDKVTGLPVRQLMINLFPARPTQVSVVQLPTENKAPRPWNDPAIRQYIETYEPQFDPSKSLGDPRLSSAGNEAAASATRQHIRP